MGNCFSGGDGNKGRGRKPDVQEPRRRLSIAHIDGGGDGGSRPVNDSEKADRSLLVELSKQTVIDIVKVPINAGGGNAQRKMSWAMETETDRERHRRASYAEKTVKEMGAPLSSQDKSQVGCACKKGLKPEAPNQDSFFVIKVPEELAIYGVFDGHGPCGHDVSDFVKMELPKILLKDEQLKQNPRQSLISAFQKTQQLLEQATEMGKLSAQFSGTTATVCLHLMETNDMYIAHVGDSRAVLARELSDGQMNDFLEARQQQGAKIDHLQQSGQENNMGGIVPMSSTASAIPKSGYVACDLTMDHKPDDPKERERIEACGGRVVFDGYYNFRVYARHGRYPGLNMSRALGDLAGYYDAGLSPVPDICYHKLNPADGTKGGGNNESPVPGAVNGKSAGGMRDITNRPGIDKFILICSDGVWEFISSQDAVDLAAETALTNANECSEMLARESWERWNKHMMGQVVDDITVVVVAF